MANPLKSSLEQSVRGLGSLLGSMIRRSARGNSAQLVKPRRDDFARSHPTTGLVPSRVAALLRQADDGSPRAQYELFEEMLQKWPRLTAVEATRRLALTGLAWEITPAESRDPRRRGLAESAAEYCRDVLAELDGLRDVLNHLAQAIGHGAAVAELVWRGSRLIDVAPVPFVRLQSDPQEPWRLRVITDDDPTWGVALDDAPSKWIVHTPHALGGRPYSAGLLRSAAPLFVAQSLSFKDWLVYSQVAGMPTRVGRFEPGTPEGEKSELLRMLEALGTDAVAAVSKNVELQFIESGRSGDKPYQPLQDYCNTEVTILWLGQHLMTDVRTSGSRAAAEIHDRVREDLLVDDIAAEALTLRRDLLRPLTMARFGADAPTPHFKRSLIQSVDTRVLVETLSIARRELGLEIPRDWAHRALGIPERDGGPGEGS